MAPLLCSCKGGTTVNEFITRVSVVAFLLLVVAIQPCIALSKTPNHFAGDITRMSAIDKRKEWIVSTSPCDERPEEKLPRKPKISSRLVLHFDINETILLGDDAGGDSRHDSVQKLLAKSAFCQLPSSHQSSIEWDDTQKVVPTHWWDGQKMGEETSLPFLYTGWEWPANCCPYYRTAYKKRSKRFVDDYEGRIYKPVLDACEEALAKNTAANHILPAFYQTLEQLILQKEPFQVVFRTFGSDIQGIAKVVTDFAQGKHPDYPHIRYPALELSPDRLFQGRWKCIRAEDKGSRDLSTGYVYELWDSEETQVVASGDEAILKFLAQYSICGIRDDYSFWKINEWNPMSGKPIWIPSYQVAAGAGSNGVYDHHLLFDDNIHNLPHDGIACVRRQDDDRGPFRTLDGATMHEDSQGVHLVRVPTIEPVLNPNWYIEQIGHARRRLLHRIVKATEDS